MSGVRGIGPETSCNNNTDEDGDGFVNDGCIVVNTGVGPETACADTTDNDNDGFLNDGCPSFDGAGESGAQCTNTTDDDGDGIPNDGCPALGAQSWVEDYTPATDHARRTRASPTCARCRTSVSA